MALKYTWMITGIKTTDIGNKKIAISSVSWKKIGTDEKGNEGVFEGVTPLNLDRIDPKTFVPLNKVDEEKVIEWLRQEIGIDPVFNGHIENVIQADIDRKTGQKEKETKLPWEK